MFTAQERLALISRSLKSNSRIKLLIHRGLTVNLVKRIGASVIIRGLRAVSDFDYEFQMALTNRSLNANAETVFLMPDEKYTDLNSTVVKEIANFGGKLSPFVPAPVASALKRKIKELDHLPL